MILPAGPGSLPGRCDMRLISWFGVILLLAGLAQPVPAAAGAPVVVDAALLERLSVGRVDFWVEFSARADLSAVHSLDWFRRGDAVIALLQQTADSSRAGLIPILQKYDLAWQPFFVNNSVYVEQGSLESALEIAAVPGIARLRLPETLPVARLFRFPLQTVTPQGEVNWSLADTGALDFWGAYGQGQGAVVASIGVGPQWTHPAIAGSYKCASDPSNPACWYDPSGECSEPCDPLGVNLGTAAISIMTGSDDPALPFTVGMAPEAKWISCRACSTYACGEPEILACAQWVLAPGGEPGNRPHIIEAHWGGQGGNDWLLTIIQAWVAAGIFPTFPVGGSGPGCCTISSPADYASVFASTAHNVERLVAPFAGRGPSLMAPDLVKPNLSLPGVDLHVAVTGDAWQMYSGTSISNAHTGGAAALLVGCDPSHSYNPQRLFDLMQETADTPPPGNCGAPPGSDGNFTYGYGYLNLVAAGAEGCGQPEYSLALHPERTEAVGHPGGIVTYLVGVENTGTSDDTYSPWWSGTWNVTLDPEGDLAVPAGETIPLLVQVAIPGDAADGAEDVLTVMLTSYGNPAVTASVELTTTARWHRQFLPLLQR